MNKCEHKNTVFEKFPTQRRFEYCLDCNWSRLEWSVHETIWAEDKMRAFVMDLQSQLQKAKYLIHHADNKHAELQADLQSERERIDDLQEINDSLVRHSNKRIADLQAQLAKLQWVSVKDERPGIGIDVEVSDGLKKYIAKRYSASNVHGWFGVGVTDEVELRITHWRYKTPLPEQPTSGEEAGK